MGYASKGHRKNVIFHILHWSHYKILLKICLKSPCNSFETKFNNQRVLEPLEISRSRAPPPRSKGYVPRETLMWSRCDIWIRMDKA